MLEKFDELKTKLDTLRQKHRDLEEAKEKAKLIENGKFDYHVTKPVRMEMIEAMSLGVDILLQRTAEDIQRAISEFAAEHSPIVDRAPADVVSGLLGPVENKESRVVGIVKGGPVNVGDWVEVVDQYSNGSPNGSKWEVRHVDDSGYVYIDGLSHHPSRLRKCDPPTPNSEPSTTLFA